MTKSGTISFHHGLKIDPDKCVGCTTCMRVCPTEAIRIRNGKAAIISGRCVDCGECYRACKERAFYVEQDDFNKIFNFKYRVALFPAVLISQFPESITENHIYAVLKELGFTHTCEVEQPISVMQETMRDFIANYDGPKPIISTFCPAVVRLIQVKYPALLEHLLLIKAPHDLAVWYTRQKLETQGINPDEAGFFYITPCAAKIAAVKSPVGEEKSVVDGIINMRYIYNRIMQETSSINEPPPQCDCLEEVSREGILWSLPGGEEHVFDGKPAISVDGVQNVIRILERLERAELPAIDFLELRSCEEGCTGGILMTGNRFLTARNQRKRALNYPTASNFPEWETIADNLRLDAIEPRPMIHLDTDMAKAFEKLARARNIMCHLPGINCGVCGAPTCSALAEDMVRGEAKMSDCIFIQERWQKEGKISSEKAFKNLEKKWGEGRFDPDCTKRGAKNESN